MKDGFIQGISPGNNASCEYRSGATQENGRKGCDVRKRLVGRAEFLMRDAFALIFFLMGV